LPGAEARWENGEIWTDTRFEVVEEKTSCSGLVTIRTLGGTIDGLHSRVEGVPEFRTGEEAYVFLWSARASLTAFSAGRRGRFELREMRGREWKP